MLVNYSVSHSLLSQVLSLLSSCWLTTLSAIASYLQCSPYYHRWLTTLYFISTVHSCLLAPVCSVPGPILSAAVTAFIIGAITSGVFMRSGRDYVQTRGKQNHRGQSSSDRLKQRTSLLFRSKSE
ncbi:hypothetical protein RRG08_005849 [Elysia crispata]|uniref:Uncharacterized protein n=1 Tax=Elysia crispata TaxID=231223 RepID=A0AAE1B1C4_9GAST|nr:hypothetical protein RRG08_005849 [Elysia crispata]